MASYRYDQRILRASDADRERVVERLRHHAGVGRLDVDELSDRVGSALTAKTVGELDDLLVDLPREDLPREDLVVPVSPSSWRDGRHLALITTGARLLLLNIVAFGIFVAPGNRVHAGLLVWIVLFSLLRLVRRANGLNRRQARLRDRAARQFPQPPSSHW